MKKAVSFALLFALCLSLTPVSPAAEAGYESVERINTYRDGIFTDVPADVWYRDDVALCYEVGIMYGNGDGTFSPNRYVTRAEVAAIAVRINQILRYGYEDLSAYENKDKYFPGPDEWYHPYLEYLFDRVITFSDHEDPMDYMYDLFYYPEDSCVRMSAAGMLWQATPEEYLTPVNDVPDNSVPDVQDYYNHSEAIYALYRAGILTGSDGGNFEPLSLLKRCEMAAIAARILDPSLRIRTSPTDTSPADTSPAELPSLSGYLYNSVAVSDKESTDDRKNACRRQSVSSITSAAADEYVELLKDSRFGLEYVGEKSYRATSGNFTRYLYAFNLKNDRADALTFKIVNSSGVGTSEFSGDVVVEKYVDRSGDTSLSVYSASGVSFGDTGDTTDDVTYAGPAVGDIPSSPTLPDMAAFFAGQLDVSKGSGMMNVVMDTLDFNAALEYVQAVIDGSYGWSWVHYTRNYISTSASFYDYYLLTWQGGGSAGTVTDYVTKYAANAIVDISRDFRSGVMYVSIEYPEGTAVVDGGQRSSYTGLVSRDYDDSGTGSSNAPQPAPGRTCSFCGGTGHRKCLTCGGDGYVVNSGSIPNYGAGGGSYSETKVCPNIFCHGGVVDCFYCGGDGVQ